MEKEYLDWYTIDEAVWTLFDTISKEYSPDLLIGISRGGLPPAVRFSHISELPLRVMGFKFYNAPGKTEERPEITIPLTANIETKRVLIIDDVADTGETLVAVKEYLERKNPADIKVAVIAKKSTSIFDPDYYIMFTDKWIVFPWEKMQVSKK
ncbi:MAG: phosphoribosyltransferase family protein [Euryarchaeota archaeon]|nr:phosphoribosyltransferase family protein [Euryarchaeota archaeon]